MKTTLPMIRLNDELIKVENFRKKELKKIAEIDRLLLCGFRKNCNLQEKNNQLNLLICLT